MHHTWPRSPTSESKRTALGLCGRCAPRIAKVSYFCVSSAHTGATHYCLHVSESLHFSYNNYFARSVLLVVYSVQTRVVERHVELVCVYSRVLTQELVQASVLQRRQVSSSAISADCSVASRCSRRSCSCKDVNSQTRVMEPRVWFVQKKLFTSESNPNTKIFHEIYKAKLSALKSK